MINWPTLIGSLSIFTLCACSGGHNPDLEQVSNAGDKTVISGTSFEKVELPNSSATIGRETLYVATTSLADIQSAAHFQLVINLKPGGHATLFAFGERAPTSLEKAVEIRLQRPLSASPISVSIAASGTTDDWSDFFKTLDPEMPIHLGIDIHNDESGEAHVLVWDFKDGDRPGLAPLVDSALDVNGSPGKGFGRNWGIAIADGELSLARQTLPRFNH